MTQIQSLTNLQVLSPTLHLYHYVLRNSINDRDNVLGRRRQFFRDNVNKVVNHLINGRDITTSDVIKIVPLQEDPIPTGNLLSFSGVPLEFRSKTDPNDDRLYFENGLFKSRLAIRRLHDAYLLRFTSYVSSNDKEQSLKIFSNLSQNQEISKLPLELGQTTILAAIIPESKYSSHDNKTIANQCLNNYFGEEIKLEDIIENKFLGSPFYIYIKPTIVQQIEQLSIEAVQLNCVFLYQNQLTERLADKVYRIFQDMLLSYHKICFFHSQSIVLKKILRQKYTNIELQTEEYARKEWDNNSLKQLPQESLEYYKRLSFLEDQERLIRVNYRNYQECIEKIENITQQSIPNYFSNFRENIEFYLEQIEASISFLKPGILLFDKLMQSVQTQVSIDNESRQKTLNERQAQLGQVFAGVGAAIGAGQIITPPITATFSFYFDGNTNQPSIQSLWFGASFSIFFSILIGYFISTKVYKWFIQVK